MEVLVFWLVPVLLLVVLTVVVANHTRDPRRRKLLFVEPLGALVKKWRPVRFVGDTTGLHEALDRLVESRFNDGAPLEMVLQLDSPRPSRPITVTERRPLGLWAEQRVIVHENHTISLIAGEVTAVLHASRYQRDGRSLLTEDDRAQTELTAARAGEHGYLALAIARRHVHSRVIEADKHTWLGLILLEPVVDESLRHQLAQLLPTRRKVLSVLPEPFLHFLNGSLGQPNPFAGITPPPKLDPRAQEETWERTSTIGSASPDLRHAVVRYFESRRDCRLLSVLPHDQALPIRIIDRI